MANCNLSSVNHYAFQFCHCCSSCTAATVRRPWSTISISIFDRFHRFACAPQTRMWWHPFKCRTFVVNLLMCDVAQAFSIAFSKAGGDRTLQTPRIFHLAIYWQSASALSIEVDSCRHTTATIAEHFCFFLFSKKVVKDARWWKQIAKSKNRHPGHERHSQNFNRFQMKLFVGNFGIWTTDQNQFTGCKSERNIEGVNWGNCVFNGFIDRMRNVKTTPNINLYFVFDLNYFA